MSLRPYAPLQPQQSLDTLHPEPSDSECPVIRELHRRHSTPSVTLLNDVDYSSLEQRVMAQMEVSGETTLGMYQALDSMDRTRKGFEGITNSMVQATAAADMMAKRMESIKTTLGDFAKEHGIVVTGLDGGEDIGIGFPDGMAPEEQLALAQKLSSVMGITQPNPDTPQQAHSMGVEHDVPQSFAVHRQTVYALGGRSMAHRLRTQALLELGRQGAQELREGASSMHRERITPTQGPRACPANRFEGQINRVSPDLARRLCKAGIPVGVGDMLTWKSVAPDTPSVIFSLADDGKSVGPIDLSLLPYKLQKRARAVQR